MTRRPVVTVALLVANVVVYLLQQSPLQDWLLVHFALWPLGPAQVDGPYTIGFEPWQIVTYGFLHGGGTHIAMNLLALWMFGAPLERLWGARPYALFYFVSVVGAAIAQLIVTGASGAMVPTVGASGGVFGLLLGFAMMYPHARIVPLFPPIPMPAWLFAILYGVAELMFGVTGTATGIAHFAHLGGMATGFVMIQYWRGKLPIKPRLRLMQ